MWPHRKVSATGRFRILSGEKKLDAQEEHDYEMSKRKTLQTGSKQRLEALLAKKNASSSESEQSSEQGPIARAMRNHPCLTKEDAMEMAEAFGF
jgi:hypothetical protein